MSLLKVCNVSKSNGDLPVLRNVSLSVDPMQKVAIAGGTGSGKTTLLKIIAGLIQPDAGEVWFEDNKLAGPNDQLIPGHSGIAYLSQHFELRNNYRVEEILSYANHLPLEEADLLYRICRINHLLKRRTDQLSGGEKQRIATARLLISSPRLLLLDEPFSNLDMFHKQMMKSVIADISDSLDISCIMVSHDPADTLSWADKIMVIREGEIIEQGKPEKLYNQPGSEYTAALFGQYNLIPSSLFANGNGPMIVRPEDITISKEHATSLKAIISDVKFFGGFYEVDVQLPSVSLKVRMGKPGLVKGDEVYLDFRGLRE